MSRLAAAKLLIKLLRDSKSLSDLKSDINKLPPNDRPLVQELCFGVARWYFRLSFIVDSFLSKPLKKKDIDVYILMLMGVYQILFTRIPDHASISETVNIARALDKEWATKLINAVLRNFIKKQMITLEEVAKNEQALYAHPNWLIEKIKYWQLFDEILQANNQHPPFCLRVNQLKMTREKYLQVLAEKGLTADAIPFTQSGIQLFPAVDISNLPYFAEGMVSIQDGAAQLAAELLKPRENDRILDACAAPGGKTCHILELQPKIKKLVALDNDPNRLQKVKDNLDRLNLKATLICHDITESSWWDGDYFDRILLDVPCSATGVIRRHPDIKLLRRPSDIPALTKIQYSALEAAWRTLKPGGSLLYVTCSILPEENESIVRRFLEKHNDCQEEIISAEWGLKVSVGRQLLPGMQSGMDGFYFAKLKRLSSHK